MDIEDRNTLNRARVAAGWSYLGLILPLIGWILGLISLSNLSSIDSKDTRKFERSIKFVKNMAIGGIVLSTAVFLMYVTAYYRYRLNVRNTDIKLVQDTIESERQCLVNAAQAFSPQIIEAENQFVGNGGAISREVVHSLRINSYLERDVPIRTYSQATQECRQTAKDKYGTRTSNRKLTATYQSCVNDYYWSHQVEAKANNYLYQLEVEYCRNRFYNDN